MNAADLDELRAMTGIGPYRLTGEQLSELVADRDRWARTAADLAGRLDQATARIRATEAILDDYRHGDLAPAAGLNRVRDALRGER